MMNPIAIFIAQIIGPIYVIVTLMMLLRSNALKGIINDFKKSPALTYIGGIMALTIGLIIMRSIISFENFTEGLVSIIGIMATVKGVSLLLCPDAIMEINYNSTAFKAFAIIFVGFLGIWLSAVGYGLL